MPVAEGRFLPELATERETDPEQRFNVPSDWLPEAIL